MSAMHRRYKHDSIVLLFGMIAVLLASGPLDAGIVVGAPGDPLVGDCIPFGCSDASAYQQIFDSSLFSGPTVIAGLRFFLNNFDNVDPIFGTPIVPMTIFSANYTISFSTVAIPVNGLDTTLENNVNPATAQTFFFGTLSDPVGKQFTITTTPANNFLYDPAAGNLLLQILSDGDPLDPSITMYMDINTTSGGLFSSGFDSVPHPFGCPDGSAGLTTGCANANSGLVVEFLTPADVNSVPEPAAIWLLLTGLALIGFNRVHAGNGRGKSGSQPHQ